MQKVNKSLHKGLLPYNQRPIIYHLVKQIPPEYRLVFLVGHLSTQIRDFVELCFPERQLVFVEVGDYTSTNAGTARSLQEASEILSESFWYTPCDAYFGDELLSLLNESNKDSVFFAASTELVNDPYQFCLFEHQGGQITNIHFKTSENPQLIANDLLVFTGLMFIKNKNEFLGDLRRSGSNEFVLAIQLGSNVRRVDSWKDFGSPVEYFKHISEYQAFDFSKPNEVTYITETKVIKWWEDSSIPIKKLAKPKNKTGAYPSNLKIQGQFLMYDKIDGEVLYSALSPDLFRSFLEWLSGFFWTRSNLNISLSIESFYFKKSKQRIEMVRQSLPYPFEETFFDKLGNELLPNRILDDFPWDLLKQDVIVTNIHGDLQFDNILVGASREFCLIDWRPEFGDEVILGDLYYDLAKLYGGMLIDYSRIKRGEFSFALSDKTYSFAFHSCPNFEEITSIFRTFLEMHSLSWRKTILLTSLIFLNMCPLHERPFSDILFFKSLELMREFSNDI
jgi:hypothetical protein